MITQVRSWGNGQGVRLSKDILDTAGIKVDDELNIEVSEGEIVLTKSFRHKTLEERAKAYGGKLGPYKEYEWGDPIGRELW